jgi:hypothetical protein
VSRPEPRSEVIATRTGRLEELTVLLSAEYLQHWTNPNFTFVTKHRPSRSSGWQSCLLFGTWWVWTYGRAIFNQLFFGIVPENGARPPPFKPILVHYLLISYQSKLHRTSVNTKFTHQTRFTIYPLFCTYISHMASSVEISWQQFCIYRIFSNMKLDFCLILHLKTLGVFCIGIFLIVKRSCRIWAVVYVTIHYQQYSYVVWGGNVICFTGE